MLDYIREHSADSETLSNIYVIDVTGLLIYFTVAAIVLRGTLL